MRQHGQKQRRWPRQEADAIARNALQHGLGIGDALGPHREHGAVHADTETDTRQVLLATDLPHQAVIAATAADAGLGAYVAAKHGVMGLTKTVALEVAENRITANTICPGYVLTPLVEKQIPDQMKVHGMDRETVIREVMLQRQPSKQFATVEQMGGTVVFLCSAAADQITGTTISVDGGWTAL